MKISDEIRNAAINWPQFIGYVEREIISSFEHYRPFDEWCHGLGYECSQKAQFQARTFMLLVAEALE